MKFYAIPVRSNGRDQLGTCGIISGEYKSLQNFIRYNRKYMDNDKLYAVYIKSNDWNFQGFHSDLPFDEHMRKAEFALSAEKR